MPRRAQKKTVAKKSGAKRSASKKAAKKTATKTATKATKKKSAAKQPPDALARLREICLALPEAHEVEAWGEPTFRVRNKLFAMHSSAGTHHGRGRPGVWIASTHVSQDMVLRARPDRYFSPPYVGPNGWVGIYLDGNPDWSEVANRLAHAHELASASSRPKARKRQRLSR